MQDADDAALDEQRDAEQGRMPFSRRIGLRMSAWSTSGIAIGRRSAAMRPAKPRPSGIAHALLDLLLDPLGRARVQRGRPPSSRIATVSTREDLGHPLQQLLQELLLGQVGERRVGDPLHRPQLAGDALRRLARVALALVELRLLDRERGAVGGELEEVAVVVGELARGEAADVQDADDAALRRAAGRRAGTGCPSRAGSG